MTLAEVEAILGPGDAILANEVPQSPFATKLDGSRQSIPVVYGQTVYRWDDGRFRRVLIGFQDGYVCSKWYWEPDL